MLVSEFLNKLEIKFECEQYERVTHENGKLVNTGKIHYRPKLIFKNGNEQLGEYWTTVTHINNTGDAYAEFYLNKNISDFLNNYKLKQFILNLI